MSQVSEPELVFSFEFDDRAAWEIEQKGWLEAVKVRLPDGKQIPICFYDPVRLSQELKAEITLGKSYLAEPGLIVPPKLTRDLMDSAVRELCSRGYFEYFVADVV
jgi:hypothetical protein